MSNNYLVLDNGMTSKQGLNKYAQPVSECNVIKRLNNKKKKIFINNIVVCTKKKKKKTRAQRYLRGVNC